MVNKPEGECKACIAICSCGWRSSPYYFDEEGGEDCANVSAIIETRLGHLAEKASENGNGNIHQITYQKLFVE